MSEHDRPQRDRVLPDPVPAGSDVGGELSSISRRVVSWYVGIAAAWIVLTDLGVGVARGDGVGERLADVAKGLVFVAVSGLALWLVLRRLTRSYDEHFARSVTAQRDFYQSILRTSSDAVLLFDEAGDVRYVNEALTEILGWEHDEVVGRPGRDLLHPSERSSADTFRENAWAAGRARRTFRMLHRDGSYRSLEVSLSTIDLAGGGAGAVLNARDVTDRARGEQQLRAALAEDATGLPNLRMFAAEMERIADVTVVGLEAVVVLVDIDRFGDVNALHGRVGGDAVLLELTRRLEATVPEAIGMWRHGADEILTVLLENRADDPDGAIDPAELVERIQRDASAPFALDDSERRVSVSVSVGIARVPVEPGSDDDPLSSRMLRTVELALADAKQHPDRSAVLVHRDAGADGTRARVVEQLHEAFDRGELVAHFQPKVRLSDLSVIGVEALARWQHPDRGLLLPGEFLGAVEQANLMATLTRKVLHDALARVPAWLEQTGCHPGFAVCVNITLDDLRRKRFVQDVFDALDATGVEPRRLCLELTEQSMLADALAASTLVAELRRNGVQVSIDDFGTGYSSLEHIRVFEVDELKIDKGFVQRIGRSRTDEAIVDSIIAIADRLEVVVTAEGIEDATALDYLRARGCDWGQGFLFGRAVPVEAFSPGQTWASLLPG